MKRAGKISLVVLLVIVGLIVTAVIFLFLATTESPESSATRFLTALAQGDVPTLTSLSDMGGKASPDVISKEWDFAVHTAGPYYHFKYRVKGAQQADPDTAAVLIEIMRNSNRADAYVEEYQIPMVKSGGHWKVDVRALRRDMFPCLPQGRS